MSTTWQGRGSKDNGTKLLVVDRRGTQDAPDVDPKSRDKLGGRGLLTATAKISE